HRLRAGLGGAGRHRGEGGQEGQRDPPRCHGGPAGYAHPAGLSNLRMKRAHMPSSGIPARTAPVLKDLYDELSAEGRVEDLAEGAFLWKEGDPGDSVVLLLEGQLDVINAPAEGEEAVMRHIEALASVR